MKTRDRRVKISILVLAGFFLAACAAVPKASLEQAAVQSRESLEAGDFQKALDSFKEPYRKRPADKALAAEYTETVEEIKKDADRAFGRRDYDRAERVYCVLLVNFVDFEGLAPGLSFSRNHLGRKVKDCRTAVAELQYGRRLKEGDYAEALHTYRSLRERYPGDADLAAAYVKAGNEIKVLGEKALAAKDFALAGKAHSLLLEKYATFHGLRPRIIFGRDDLAKSITMCRSGLANRGLALYRKGDLTQAIAVWESLLAFDPDNIEIKKAAETARSQSDKLIKKK